MLLASILFGSRSSKDLPFYYCCCKAHGSTEACTSVEAPSQSPAARIEPGTCFVCSKLLPPRRHTEISDLCSSTLLFDCYLLLSTSSSLSSEDTFQPDPRNMSATLTRSLRALRIATRSSPLESLGAAGPSTVAARRCNSGDAASAAGDVAPSEGEGAQAASSASAAPAADSSASALLPTSTSAPSATASSSRKPSPSPTAFQPALAHYPIPRPSTFISSTHLPADALPQHQHINFPQRQFAPPAPSAKPATLGGNEQARKEAMLSATTGLSVAEIKGLRRYTVRVGRVTQMTKKGKM